MNKLLTVGVLASAMTLPASPAFASAQPRPYPVTHTIKSRTHTTKVVARVTRTKKVTRVHQTKRVVRRATSHRR